MSPGEYPGVIESPLRHQGLHRLSTILTVVGMVAGLVLIVISTYQLSTGGGAQGAWRLLAAGIMLVVFPPMLHLVVVLAIKAETNINRVHHDALDLLESLRKIEPQVRVLAHNSEISDAARSITHREKESEALRQAIREEMYSGNWEAAHYLVDEIERRFGYRQEAQALRRELAEVREMTIEEKIGEALSHIDKLMNEHRWDRARQESDRLLKLFPRHERVLDLPAEINRRREMHKQQLLAEWRVAVQREEVDRGIEILTQLDQYLTKEEAADLRESARHVFKARLLNLGVQFGLAASESRWRDALEVGLQIQQEFPNSRMAREIAEKTDTLRVRAGFVPDAELTQHRVPAGEPTGQ